MKDLHSKIEEKNHRQGRLWLINYFNLIYRVGTFPQPIGLTLAILAIVFVPLNVKSMLLSSTSSHGTPMLQIRMAPSLVAEVPIMFLKLTLLIFTFDGVYSH